jgi:hypothetical protein
MVLSLIDVQRTCETHILIYLTVVLETTAIKALPQFLLDNRKEKKALQHCFNNRTVCVQTTRQLCLKLE